MHTNTEQPGGGGGAQFINLRFSSIAIKTNEDSWAQFKPLRMIRASSQTWENSLLEQLSNCGHLTMNSIMSGF